ncbi:hypothetical protein T492DRAFT_877251 [Pavlovales sp. CCMP2436]|nr:hypothetical protein T492DRAFT_877251 [Pavlovales sp. CCMP2436]
MKAAAAATTMWQGHRQLGRVQHLAAFFENIGGGGTAHFGADNDGTEVWAEGAYHQR